MATIPPSSGTTGSLSSAATSLVTGDATVPAVCYDICNDASLEAQSVGKTPELCSATSHFREYYDGCVACIQDNVQEWNMNSAQAYLDVKYGAFLEFCAAVPAIVVPMPTTSPSNTIPASWLIPVTVTAVTEVYDLNGSIVTATWTATASYTRPDWTGFLTSLVSKTAAPPPPESNSTTPAPEEAPSRAWIAGPVVGSVAVVILAVLAGIFVHRRRRRRAAARDGEGGKAELDANAHPKLAEKAQLHSDPAMVHEMDANQQHELPAREVAALEMPAWTEGR